MKNLIGIIGCINSGKDTVGNIILENVNNTCEWEIKKFADKLKDIVCILLNCTREDLENRVFKETELSEDWWYYKLPNDQLISYLDENQPNFITKYELIKLSPRKLLQLLGTDCGRNIIHPDIWVSSLFSEYYGKQSNWIITDVRFPNEALKIKKKGGILIKMLRNIDNPLLHESEIHIPTLYSDYIIDNRQLSVKELKSTVCDLILPLL